MPLADLASSAESFADATVEFFGNLSAIEWGPFGLALCCLAAMQLARAWAWRNVLRAAYPGVRIPFLRLGAAYLIGAGISALAVPPLVLSRRQNMPADSTIASNGDEPEIADPGLPRQPAIESDAG